MANTKFQFKYGQYGKSQAIEMSKVAGSVIYSGVTRGIYVDGKEFVSGEGADKDIQNIISLLGAVKNEETGLYELSGLTNLPEGVKKEVTDVLNSLTPGQQAIKIVNDELVKLHQLFHPLSYVGLKIQ